jgi:hypothetical protein
MTKQELSLQLKSHVSSNNFKDGKQVFDHLIQSFLETIDGWDVFYALKIQRAGINIEQIESISEKFLDFGPVKNMFVLYLKDKYIDTLDQQNFRNHELWIEKITQISEQKNFNLDSVDPYPCNYTRGVLKILKFYRKPNLNIEKVAYWIGKLDPTKLSKSENNFKDAEGKERTLASPMEDYYSILSDLKLKERQYEECIEICDFTLGQFSKFHYDNDIWLKRRKALCLIELDKQDEAFEILVKLSTNRKGEKWFIFHEIAKLYFEKEEYSKALDFYVKAIALPRDEDKKINLYADCARCLFKLKRMEDAKLIAELIASVSVKENLSQKSDVIRIFQYFKINIEEIKDAKSFFFTTKARVLDMFNVKINQKNSTNNRDRIKRKNDYTAIEKSGELLQGKVIKILNDNERGKDGFLLIEKKQHYFSMSKNFHLSAQISVGCNVECRYETNKLNSKNSIRIVKLLS